MLEFGKLLCGKPQDNMFEFSEIINNLIQKIDYLSNKILTYNWIEDEANIDISFYARNMLETALTALLGRTDPFRVITVYKVQSTSDYDLGKKSESAVQWSGDIIAGTKGDDLWNVKRKKDSFDRALLSNHQGEIIWKPGFAALSDYVQDKGISSVWLDDILSDNENSNFEKCKSESARLFSSFSKGVHSESLVDISVIFDIITLKNLIKDLFKLCATLGLISHFIGYLVPNLSIDEAVHIFCEMEEKVNEL